MSKAREIAEERLAKGEITEEEFERIITKFKDETSHSKTVAEDAFSGLVNETIPNDIKLKALKLKKTLGEETLGHISDSEFISDYFDAQKTLNETIKSKRGFRWLISFIAMMIPIILGPDVFGSPWYFLIGVGVGVLVSYMMEQHVTNEAQVQFGRDISKKFNYKENSS